MVFGVSMPEGARLFLTMAERARDFNTGEPQTDKATGLPLWRCDVMVLCEGERPEHITVKVASKGDMASLPPMSEIAGFRNLCGVLYGNGNRSISLRGGEPLAKK